jgi:hypothetical protein
MFAATCPHSQHTCYDLKVLIVLLLLPAILTTAETW